MEDTFYYDPTSPSALRWKRSSYSGKSNGKLQVSQGDIAGSLNGSSQYEVWFEGRLQQCHRIVYQLEVGPISDGKIIDHINGDRSDNKIENLRVVDYITNSRNRKKSVKNRTGITGVYQDLNKRGELVGYVASWQLLEGYKRDYKRFSFSTYGEDALNAAKWWRELMIDFLNADGAGYTPNHGLRE